MREEQDKKVPCFLGTGEQNYISPCTTKNGIPVTCTERITRLCFSLLRLKKKKGR